MSKDEEIQMKISEYEKKYVSFENLKSIKTIIKIIFSFATVVLLYVFFSICLKAFQLNFYVGIISIILCILILIFCFVLPIYKLIKIGHFEVNVNSGGVVEAKKHNNKICLDIAKNIIDFNNNVDDAFWYDKKEVENIEIALKKNNINEIRDSLTNIMNGSIRKSSNKIIVKRSMNAAVHSAVSQTAFFDMVLILIQDVQMIKDIVFLYGFRPSTIRMYNIIKSVLIASAVAAGLQSTQAGSSVLKKIISLFRGGANAGAVGTAAIGNIPSAVALGLTSGVLQLVTDSAVQGVTNGMLTTCIGYQTIGYLNKEYKLQEILDKVDILDDENEFKETYEEVLKQSTKNHT